MASVNKAFLLGNVGRDAELRYIASGKAVCTFSMATSERWEKDGEKQEKTTWHQIVIWGKVAEWAGKNIKKGDPVFVEGRIENRTYDDKDGNKRFVSEVNAVSVQALGRTVGVKNEDEVPAKTETRIQDDESLPF